MYDRSSGKGVCDNEGGHLGLQYSTEEPCSVCVCLMYSGPRRTATGKMRGSKTVPGFIPCSTA